MQVNVVSGQISRRVVDKGQWGLKSCFQCQVKYVVNMGVIAVVGAEAKAKILGQRLLSNSAWSSRCCEDFMVYSTNACDRDLTLFLAPL